MVCTDLLVGLELEIALQKFGLLQVKEKVTMEKIEIDSSVSDTDNCMVEQKLSDLLSSIAERLNTVRVTISLKSEIEQSSLNYRCEIEGVDEDFRRFLSCEQHKSLQQALEGAADSLLCSFGKEEEAVS